MSKDSKSLRICKYFFGRRHAAEAKKSPTAPPRGTRRSAAQAPGSKASPAEQPDRKREEPREEEKDRTERNGLCKAERTARSGMACAKQIGPHETGWPVQSGKLCAERNPRPAGQNRGAVPAPGGNRSPAMPRHTASAPRSRRPARTALRAAAESGWRTPQRIFSSSRALLTAAFSAFRAALASFRAIRFATRACSFPILSATRTSWRRSRTSPRTSRRS